MENQITFADEQQDAPAVASQPQEMPQAVSPAQENAGGVAYAGFWVRWVAVFLDGLILIIPNLIIGVIFTAIGVPVLGTLLSYIVMWSYYIVMTKQYGATLGKQAVGVRVLSDKSADLSWGQLILRETVGKILSGITLLIGYIMAGFTQRKQALHDKIASTVVVYNYPNKRMPVWAIIIAAILPVILILGLVASIVLVSLNSARNKAIEARDAATNSLNANNVDMTTATDSVK